MRGRPPIVLMYHGVGTVPPAQDPHHMFVPAAAFRAQLEYLMHRGVRLLTEAQFLRTLEEPLDEISALITFDDGYTSVRYQAAPILADLGVPAVCYVLPGLLGGTSIWMPEAPHHRLMTGKEVLELESLGVAVGCHSHDHKALAGSSMGELERQVTGAIADLSDLLGKPVKSFAYPYGYHDDLARAVVSRSSVECAFATYNGAGRWAFPRVDINALDTERTFRLKLLRAYPWVRKVTSYAPPVRRALHTLVGQADRSVAD